MAVVLGHCSTALVVPVEVGSSRPTTKAEETVTMPRLLIGVTH